MTKFDIFEKTFPYSTMYWWQTPFSLYFEFTVEFSSNEDAPYHCHFTTLEKGMDT